MALATAAFVAACGSERADYRGAAQAQADSQPLKLAVFEVPGGTGRQLIVANATVPIVDGSFEYCVGAGADCQAGGAGRRKLAPLPSGPQGHSFHRVPGEHDLSQIGKLGLYAVDAASQAPLTTVVRFQRRGDGSIEIVRFPFSPAELEGTTAKVKGVDFDYVYGQGHLAPTVPMLRLKVTNQDLLQAGAALGVVLSAYSLESSKTAQHISTAVKADGQGGLTVTGEGLKPETVYKVRVHFFRLSGPGSATLMGTAEHPYFMVTEGVSGPVAKARTRLVMRGFAEYQDWELGRYDRSKGYTDDPGYGWCHMFYDWVIKEQLTTKPGSQHTHYNSSYWQQFNAVIKSSDLPELGRRDKIHGDFFRTGGHAAMLLAFDADKNQVWTLEGNFNNRVEIHQRTLGQLNWVGHIDPRMLRTDSQLPP